MIIYLLPQVFLSILCFFFKKTPHFKFVDCFFLWVFIFCKFCVFAKNSYQYQSIGGVFWILDTCQYCCFLLFIKILVIEKKYFFFQKNVLTQLRCSVAKMVLWLVLFWKLIWPLFKMPMFWQKKKYFINIVFCSFFGCQVTQTSNIWHRLTARNWC